MSIEEVVSEPVAAARFLALMGYEPTGIESELVRRFTIDREQAHRITSQAITGAAETHKQERAQADADLRAIATEHSTPTD